MAAKPTVLELIHSRMRDAATGKRYDSWKLAVVVEGGGLKYVTAGGMMSLLEHYGFTPDLMVGSSSGGVVAAYFAAGMMSHGNNCYRYLNRKGFARDGRSRRFIDPRRLLKRQPPMDIEGLVENVMVNRVPMDWEALRSGRIPVWVTASSREGKLVMQPLHGVSEEKQKMALKNTSRIPFAAHNPRDMDVLWDGGLLANIPVAEAFALGATHVLVVRCSSALKAKEAGAHWRHLVTWMLRLRAPDMHTLMVAHLQKHEEKFGLTGRGWAGRDGAGDA